MELRSGLTLRSEPPLRSRRPCRPLTGPYGDTDGVDHISGLPDDLLLQILVRLRCDRAAAHTSLLSRRWRGLWRHLPELSFRGLAQVSRTELCLLDIDVPEHHRYSTAGVDSLLRTAARLAPVVLSLEFRGDMVGPEIPVELNIFHRATSISLNVTNRVGYLYLRHPPLPAQGGEFSVLERLSISGCYLDIDTSVLVLQCPRLRVLELRHYWLFGAGVVHLHSTTIEELVVAPDLCIGGIDIVAPALKKFTMDTYMTKDFNVSVLAPMVKDIHWRCKCAYMNVAISEMWCLHELNLRMEESVCVLDLIIEMRNIPPDDPVLDLKQQIVHLPNFSVSRLDLITWGHVFGAMVLNLLGICAGIQSLKLFIDRVEQEACPPNCPCVGPQDWRNQNISLMALEEVEIHNLEGSGHEVEFVKLVFRCAPLMKRMTVKLSPKVLPGNSGCKEICDILKAKPSVECCL
ncbi:hypothetical protein C2845_PM03G07180 [Panicum miliaceum]|uniref:F-box domain-containing protein n=1 Tax=Panicum miliaceum TaxID=4540 RepID=A0A3L6T8H6_PANMI|nr:hypothetical protein C2845_PM03G07180 [Panicum miliaceum]